ncbi:hypothetical protein MNBD_DELTA04-320 [hydrothermal vent metagenome]|uniref:Cytochrome b/b6 N-terminal region profile domain-containing protein n=1 Tax=hydrothermal vent metagenome TaxID=652676 RepID=A0A3B0W5Q6_9ZZZZ
MISQAVKRPFGLLKQKALAVNWGGQALISLYISILSGLVIALQYNTAEPFYSTATIEIIVPYGDFWRSLHYYSSQAFMLLLLCHLAAAIWENNHYYSRLAWVRLTLSVPVALLLLFTGYILRNDATGAAAGAIAEHITLSIPLIGRWLNDIFLAITANGLRRVYVNHLIGLIVLGGYCVWPHLRRYTSRWRDHLPLILLFLLLATLLLAPMEPDKFGLLHIAGPWFFLGLQELLRTVQPFWAGVVFPAAIVVALLTLPREGRERSLYLIFIGLWFAIYTVLSVISYSRT